MGSKITKKNVLFFFITKSSNFISNTNDHFYEASFEVYYVSVSQKLVILGFSPKVFFHFDLGHFQNLLRPNNEPQQPHILAEDVSIHMKYCFCWGGMKVEAFRDRYLSAGTFGPPCLLNWPKSLHWLGLNVHYFVSATPRYHAYRQTNAKYIQCNLDLVTPYLLTNRDLVTILQKTILVHKNFSFSDNLVFSATSI